MPSSTYVTNDVGPCSKNVSLPGLLHKVSSTVVGHCQERGGEMMKGMMGLPAQEESYSFQCDPLE
jgi:hypothetical protein